MPSHSQILKLARPGNHFVGGASKLFIGCGQSQHHRVVQQFYRVGERQGRLSRVSLVAKLDTKSGSHQAAVPVTAFGMSRRVSAVIGGTSKAVRRAAMACDGHSSASFGGVQHADSDALGFRVPVRDAAPQPDERQDRAHKVLGVVSLRRRDAQAARALGVAGVVHGGVSGSLRCGNYVPGVSQ